MKAMTYSHARKNLKQTIQDVIHDRDPAVITTQGDKAVVMLSLDDFESLQETVSLLRSPANGRRLMTSIEELASDGKPSAI